MRIGIASDHGGLGLKEDLRERLAPAGHDVVEFGALMLDPGDDYPDFVLCDETRTTSPAGGEAAAISAWALCGN